MKFNMQGKYPVGKIILVTWVVFSILYVGYAQYKYFKNFVYQKGLSNAITRVIQQAKECKAFPVSVEGQGVTLVNIACLTNPEGEE